MARAEADVPISVKAAAVSSVSIPPIPEMEFTVGVPVDVTLPTPVGGVPPYSWAVDPPLPDGVTLDSNAGKLSGTPTAAVAKTTYKFSIE